MYSNWSEYSRASMRTALVQHKSGPRVDPNPIGGRRIHLDRREPPPGRHRSTPGADWFDTYRSPSSPY